MSTHDEFLDQSFSFCHHLSELCDEMQIFRSAFSVSQLLLRTLQPAHEGNTQAKKKKEKETFKYNKLCL